MKEDMEKQDKKIKLPGMRVIKTIISVYICFLISFIRNGLPFYSAIAAILCMQNDNANSFEAGKSRMIGTFIGGIYGFIAIVLINFVNIELFNYIHYLILSLFLVPIIYTNVFLKANSSTYISCVVFFSITISHGGDIAPMYFALNRIIDTLIGIVVSLTINLII
ncbi:aromatic acid exporter family protein [Tissierella sp. MB52-C2]|uniref:FUSC family protein n=1 Tax=Tissierella sp. MB52-C2 TaxID=3070999 RepID=UPI00280BC566|nr:FUSC family protein [Tissierella sp. MB52-C2]WMM25809.1 aromatic acid exporter family protein [Tissierella sp. MB52-C2]